MRKNMYTFVNIWSRAMLGYGIRRSGWKEGIFMYLKDSRLWHYDPHSQKHTEMLNMMVENMVATDWEYVSLGGK